MSLRSSLVFFAAFSIVSGALANSGHADRVQLQAAACAVEEEDKAWALTSTTGMGNGETFAVDAYCPVLSDNGDSADTGDAFDYIRATSLTVDVRDLNDAGVVSAQACLLDASGISGSCSGSSATSSVGTGYSSLSPNIAVWTSAASGADYPYVHVILPATDTAGNSYIIGYFVIST
jgi:hypothetical protein